jgi:hypothetical protein
MVIAVGDGGLNSVGSVHAHEAVVNAGDDLAAAMSQV